MVGRWTLLLGLLLGAAWGAAVPAPVHAQADATLRVVVTSAEDGGPLQGGNVTLTPPGASAPVRAGATDRDGYLALRGVAPGRYVLAVTYLGFAPHRDTLTLQSGTRVYDVPLTAAPQRLGELTVEARRGEAARQAGLQNIRPADLGRVPTPGPSADLAGYLQTLPGVVSVGDRGGQLYIEGGAPPQNRYLVDGFPVTKPFHISSFYSAFPQSIIQSADLYAGGFGAQYGEATSSVLDVRLRPGNLKQYDGSAAVGPHLAALQVEGPIDRGSESFLLSTRYSLLEQTAEPLVGEEAPIGFYDVTGRYSWQSGEYSCNVTALRTHDRGRLGPDETRELTWANTVVGGRCLVLEEEFDRTFSIRGGYSGFRNSVGTVGDPEQRAGRWRVYLMLNYDEQVFGQPLDFGTRVTAGHYDATIDEQFAGIEQLSRTQGMVRLHWTLDWTVNDHLSVVPSLAARVTYSVEPSVDPRVRMTYQPDGTDRQELGLALGLYHQIDGGISDLRDAGNVFTLWRPPASGQPLPSALHGIAGYTQRVGSWFEGSVEGYAKRLRNIPVTTWTPEVGLDPEAALATGITYGASAQLEVQEGPFFASVGYGWSTVTYEAATDDLGAWVDGRVFSYSPAHDRRHQVNVISSYEWRGVTANVRWQFGSGRPFTKVYGYNLALGPTQRATEAPGTAQTIYERPFGARLPTYHRLDTSLERSFALSDRLALDVTLGAINLYGRRNIFYYDLDTLQRVNQSPLLPYVSLKLRAD